MIILIILMIIKYNNDNTSNHIIDNIIINYRPGRAREAELRPHSLRRQEAVRLGVGEFMCKYRLYTCM